MSKIESTAINDLIQMGRPLERDSDELAFDRPLGGPRRRIRITTALPARELPTLAPRITPPAHLDPIARGSLGDHCMVDAVTHRVRRAPAPRVPRALAVSALTLATIATAAASYRVLHGASTHTAAVTVAPMPPAPIVSPTSPASAPTPSAPTVSPIAPAPAPRAPAFVDVQLASEPAGATVTLVDDGHPTLLGTTPLTAALDPSRRHDLLFALADHAPQVAHVDPSTARELAIAFPAVEATPPPAHVRARHPHREARTGLLMISSKPPCEIHVDGKPTGLTTPQRAIELPAGHHRITLVNPGAHVKQTFPVHIAADRATKLIEDLMK